MVNSCTPVLLDLYPNHKFVEMHLLTHTKGK